MSRRGTLGSREDRDLMAATVLVLTGAPASVGGGIAVVTGQVLGGRPVGALQTVYGVALLWAAWQVIWRLSWSSFLVGAPLLLLSDPLAGLLYDRANHWWPNILAVLVVIEWGRRLIWPSRRTLTAPEQADSEPLIR